MYSENIIIFLDCIHRRYPKIKNKTDILWLSGDEPLIGRKWEYKIYPLSFSEMVSHHGLLEESDGKISASQMAKYTDLLIASSIGNDNLEEYSFVLNTNKKT